MEMHENSDSDDEEDIIQKTTRSHNARLDFAIQYNLDRPFYIGVVAHGMLKTSGDVRMPSLVPNGMTLSTITATHPGKSNFANRLKCFKVLQSTNLFLKNQTSTEIPFTTISDKIAALPHHTNVTVGPEIFEDADYAQTRGQTRVMTYSSGEPFLSKIFAGMWMPHVDKGDKLVVLDYLSPEPAVKDVTFALRAKNGDAKETEVFETTTTDILNILKSKGINNLVLIDFSCSSFSRADLPGSVLGIRALQFDIMNKGYAGGARKKTKTKTKKKFASSCLKRERRMKTRKKSKKGGFFFSNKTVDKAECDPNQLSMITDAESMHAKYQKCCPKGVFGSKNSSPYCKQLELNFNPAIQRENNAGDEDAAMMEHVYDVPMPQKKAWWKFWGGKKSRRRLIRRKRRTMKRF